MLIPSSLTKVVIHSRRKVDRRGYGKEAEVDIAAGVEELMWWKEEMRFERRIFETFTAYVSLSFSLCSFDFLGEGVLWIVLKSERSAGYAAPRIWMELFSGVIVGRERRQGVVASSKTEVKLVRSRMSEPLWWMGCRILLKSLQPIRLNVIQLSSIKARMAGTRRGKCASRWTLSVGCRRVSLPERRTRYWNLPYIAR